ncbi:MAG: hypothetical protein IJS68_00515 [Clostridia bacterium]|nr:hypothetical protein [Clostridia bacterium]
MGLSKKAMIIGVVLTLVCAIVGVVCVCLLPTTFTWIMLGAILALSIFQAVVLFLAAKKSK